MRIVETTSGWTLIDSDRPTVPVDSWPSEAPTKRRSAAPTTPAPNAGTDLESCKMYAAVSVRGGLTSYMVGE
jgi:hypothetical protein